MTDAGSDTGTGACPHAGVRDFPFPEGPDVRPTAEYLPVLRQPGLPTVRLSNGSEALLVTRYAEVRAVLSDDRFSRAKFPGRPMFARNPESLALAVSDPPEHNRRRRAVLPWFTARRAKEQTPWLRQLADELLDDLMAQPQPVDLVSRFAVPLPLRAIGDILGIPRADLPRLRVLAERMMSTTRFTPDEVSAAHDEAHAYFDALVATREAEAARGAPGADLLSELLAESRTKPAADRLSRQEIVVFGSGLLMAGFDTTSNQLAMCVLMLFGDPDLVKRVRAEPDALAPAVEEMLRWSSLIATGGASHIATEDVRLGDTLVRAGQVVVPVTDSANQDPAIFDDPGRFDPERADNPHVAFGFGRHYCLGAPLARAELQVGLAALLRRFDELTVAVPVDELVWRRGMLFRGPRELPIRWTPAPADPAAGRAS